MSDSKGGVPSEEKQTAKIGFAKVFVGIVQEKLAPESSIRKNQARSLQLLQQIDVELGQIEALGEDASALRQQQASYLAAARAKHGATSTQQWVDHFKYFCENAEHFAIEASNALERAQRAAPLKQRVRAQETIILRFPGAISKIDEPDILALASAEQNAALGALAAARATTIDKSVADLEALVATTSPRLNNYAAWCSSTSKSIRARVAKRCKGATETAAKDASLSWAPPVVKQVTDALAQLRVDFLKDPVQGVKDLNNFEGKVLKRSLTTRYDAAVLAPVQAAVDAAKQADPGSADALMGPILDSTVGSKDKSFDSRLLRVAELMRQLGGPPPELVGPPANMSWGDMVAVHAYTDEDYKDMNRLLRGADPEDTKDKKALQDKIDVTLKAMKKMPAFTQGSPGPVVVTRGMKSYPGWEKEFPPGGVYKNPTFLSAGMGFSFPGDVQITITCPKCSGKNVALLSRNPNENEILFPPGTTFTVSSVMQDKSGPAPVWRVAMVETAPAP